MNFVHSNLSLNLFFILSTKIILINGDKFIGSFLKSKVRNYTIYTSNGVDHKLWMKYLEKRLQIISLDPLRNRQIFSMTHFYKLNLKTDILRMYVLCGKEETTFLDIVQHGIFGSICASYKSEKYVDPCMYVQDTKNRENCYSLGK